MEQESNKNDLICHKTGFDITDKFIIHISEDLFTDKNLFNFFLGLTKLKKVFSNNKIYIIYDCFLPENYTDYIQNLFKKINFKNIEFLYSKDLIKNISFNVFFDKYLKKAKLYLHDDCSLLDKTNICLYALEKELLNAKQILLPNTKMFYHDGDLITFDEHINHHLQKETLLNDILDPTLLFGLIMSLSDNDMKEVLIALYDKDYEEFENLLNNNPFKLKKYLAKTILDILFEDKRIGELALTKFEQRSLKLYDNFDTIPIVVKNTDSLFNVLYSSNKFKSKSELLRLFKQNAVRNFNNDILSFNDVLTGSNKIKVGKKLLFSLEIRNDT